MLIDKAVMMGASHAIEKYNSIIFDFDGVILNSNEIKKRAVSNSVKGVLSEDQRVSFVDYFVHLNGIPREEKFAKFIPIPSLKFVLQRYEDILAEELAGAELIPGVRRTLDALYEMDKKMIVLSGGSQSEVASLLKARGMTKYFVGIYGGPLRKESNLEKVELKPPVLYFGDSIVDFELAKANGFDFIFVYGESSITDWQKTVGSWGNVRAIKNFKDEWCS